MTRRRCFISISCRLNVLVGEGEGDGWSDDGWSDDGSTFEDDGSTFVSSTNDWVFDRFPPASVVVEGFEVVDGLEAVEGFEVLAPDGAFFFPRRRFPPFRDDMVGRWVGIVCIVLYSSMSIQRKKVPQRQKLTKETDPSLSFPFVLNIIDSSSLLETNAMNNR